MNHWHKPQPEYAPSVLDQVWIFGVAVIVISVVILTVAL